MQMILDFGRWQLSRGNPHQRLELVAGCARMARKSCAVVVYVSQTVGKSEYKLS